MGRDEMNLAEFPLATLADKAPSGCKTLVFEDRIWDHGQQKHITRRLTITASDKFGLPTALDDEVILGLVQLSKEAGFADRCVPFSLYQLIHLLGWREEGKSYTRVRTSLKRWLGVTLFYENAWWDKCHKRWVDAHFHLLDNLWLYRGANSEPVRCCGNRKRNQSYFSWNDIVYGSFRSGYLKRLDLDFYRTLRRSTTKRVYRFLDKRFHHSKCVRFDLRRFACEHIGLSRKYDAGQLKRRLIPALVELEQAGFLQALPPAARFRRLRRGEWEVLFLRGTLAVPSSVANRHWTAEERELVDRGVTPATAARLARDFSPQVIRAKLEIFDQLCQRQDRRVSRNPAGYLVKSIREDYLPPPGFFPVLARPTPAEASDKSPSTSGTPRPEKTKESRWTRTERQVEAFLSQLSPEERNRIEAEAVTTARGLMAEGLRRATASGNKKMVQDYRRAILLRRVRDLTAEGERFQAKTACLA
jgi:hypothetical protein